MKTVLVMTTLLIAIDTFRCYGSRPDGEGLPVKPSVKFSLNLRLFEPKKTYFPSKYFTLKIGARGLEDPLVWGWLWLFPVWWIRPWLMGATPELEEFTPSRVASQN